MPSAAIRPAPQGTAAGRLRRGPDPAISEAFFQALDDL
jgi:hypothetical protein